MCSLGKENVNFPRDRDTMGQPVRPWVSSSARLTSMLMAFDEECQCFNLISTYFRWVERCWNHHIFFFYLHMYISCTLYTHEWFEVLVLELQGYLRSCALIRGSIRIPKQPKSHKPYLLAIRKHPKLWIVPQSYPQSLCQWWFCSIDFIGRKLQKHLISISCTFKNFPNIDCMSCFSFPLNRPHTRRHGHAVGDPWFPHLRKSSGSYQWLGGTTREDPSTDFYRTLCGGADCCHSDALIFRCLL